MFFSDGWQTLWINLMEWKGKWTLWQRKPSVKEIAGWVWRIFFFNEAFLGFFSIFLFLCLLIMKNNEWYALKPIFHYYFRCVPIVISYVKDRHLCSNISFQFNQLYKNALKSNEIDNNSISSPMYNYRKGKFYSKSFYQQYLHFSIV